MVRLEDAQGRVYFPQSFKGAKSTRNHCNGFSRFFIDNRGKFRECKLYVCLYKKTLFSGEWKQKLKHELDVRPLIGAICSVE